MYNRLDSRNRHLIIRDLGSELYDLVIIGGGITGVGIALDAASRGLKVALIERRDFASGTSSKSTKLIHGGLRYLKQMAFRLVEEVGRERAIVHRMAPYLVHPEKMLLPIYKEGSLSKWTASLALSTYDYLAHVSSADKKRMLSVSEAIDMEPLLNRQHLRGAAYYTEYRTDDARLTLEIIKTAVLEYNVTCLNYMSCNGFTYNDTGKISGVKTHDSIGGQMTTIRTKVCVSAAGPWVDNIRQKDDKDAPSKLVLAKGVHLVFDHQYLPVKQAMYFDVPKGSRMIFAIPRGNKTYVGTTDNFYDGDIDSFKILKNEVDYLLSALNETFPNIELSTSDIRSSWAGVRPLIAKNKSSSASEVSRKDEIFTSRSGLISIAGGKLTGFRKMAERTVDHVFKAMNLNSVPCRTAKIMLGGTKYMERHLDISVRRAINDLTQTLGSVEVADYLFKNYGMAAWKIADEGSSSEVGYIQAELEYLIENELVHSTGDILARRTGRLYFDPESISGLEPIIHKLLEAYGLWHAELEKQWHQEKSNTFNFH